MKNVSSKSEKKFQRVMHEFGQGELKSHGKKVTDQKQAVAIAFSEARKVYPNYGIMKEAGEVKPTATKGLFYLDAIEGKEFSGYTFGDDWNGWETPYFEKPAANLIMEALGGTYKDGKYLFDDGYGGEEEYEKQTIDTVDGPKDVYAIGAYSWTWSSAEKKSFQLSFKDQPPIILQATSADDADEIYRSLTTEEATALGINSALYEGIEPEKIEEVPASIKNGGGITPARAAELAKIYSTGTAKELWGAWTPENRIHFLMDHSTEYFELMGDDFYKSSKGLSALTYDTLPSPIRKSLLIHHAQGIYSDGGGIKSDNKINEGIDLFEDYENIPPKVQKILDKYADGFEEGDYDVLKKELSEVEKQGYTFDYYLDGQAYDLRKIGEMGKVEYAEKNGLMYNGGSVIGETRAKEIVRNVLDDAKANNISLPKLEKFIAEGPQPGVLIEAYSEFSKAVNNGDNPKSLRLNYEDSNRFTNYVKSLLPNSIQRKMFKHYGDAPIKNNFPGYAGGGGIPGSKKKEAPKFAIGDKVMVDDTGYAKKFEGFDLTKPATIRDINKSKSGGKTYYFYKLEMANGDKPFNQAEEDTLTLVSMAGGGSIPSNLSPSKKKLLDRINTLKATKANAGEAAQKSIQKKIDVLQRQFDYNPSAKEKAMANKGKFALDVPASYSKTMYKKLWAMKVFPQIHKLNGTHSIVVNSKANLDKAYEVFSDMLKEKKEKVPSLASISRKL